MKLKFYPKWNNIMKKYSLYISIFLLVAIAASILWVNIHNTGKSSYVERYGVLSRVSTSGDVRFSYYDIEQGRVLDEFEGHPWFFAMIEKMDDEKRIDDYVKYVRENESGVFKITGEKEPDDCEYYGDSKCLENIRVIDIQVIGDRKSD